MVTILTKSKISQVLTWSHENSILEGYPVGTVFLSLHFKSKRIIFSLMANMWLSRAWLQFLLQYLLNEATNSIASPSQDGTVIYHIFPLPSQHFVTLQKQSTGIDLITMATRMSSVTTYKISQYGKKIRFYLTTGSSGIASAGLLNLAMKLAHARPKTTRSSKELAPSLLAPWTEAHADSPAAQRPGTISSLPSFFVNACNEVKDTSMSAWYRFGWMRDVSRNEGGIRIDRTFNSGMRDKIFRRERDLLILKDGMWDSVKICLLSSSRLLLVTRLSVTTPLKIQC